MNISTTWLSVIAATLLVVPSVEGFHHRDTKGTETAIGSELRVLRASVVNSVSEECSVTPVGQAKPQPPKKDQPKKDQKQPAKQPAPPTAKPAPVAPAPPVPPPPGYVIGPDDVLQVLYWREKDLSAEVTVRPDGMISLPLVNDVAVNGLTPDQLRDKVTEAARRYVEDPSVTIVVKQINSRKVFITGEVAKPGPYPLTAPTTVLQLIATAGGLTEFAKKGDITIMRVENGKPVSYPFNYKDVTKRKNLKQNIELKPGDTVIVP